MYYIQATCFGIEEISVFVGSDAGMRAYLDKLSRDGWQVVKAYEL